MTLDQDLFPEFLHNVEEYRMVEDNQKVLLTVSGGLILWLSFIFYAGIPSGLACGT